MENRKTEIEQAKAILKQYGYFVDNLWSVSDVTDRYDCTDKKAQEVLNKALTNESVVEQILFAIDDECDDDGIELKEEEGGEEDHEN
jgi:hypothetical protein